MPHFCKCGADEYICQECATIHCSKEEPSKWVHIPRTGREGNMCPTCFDEYESFHGTYANKPCSTCGSTEGYTDSDCPNCGAIVPTRETVFG